MNHNDTGQLAQDVYSQTLTRLLDNPEAATTKGSTINVTTLLGHSQTWVVRTIRIAGQDTAFVQRVDSDGGMRLVLPPEVVLAIARQRDSLVTQTRKRAARKAVETRRAKGKP